MTFKFPFALVLALCGAMLAPAVSQAADAVPTYAVMSLIGDAITTDVYKATTGSRLEGNQKQVIPLEDKMFEQEAIQSANTVLKRMQPDIKTVLMITPDTGLYAAQNSMFEDIDKNKDNREYLKSLLKNRNASYLVLITKYRADASFKFTQEREGRGKLEGIGFYVDNEMAIASNASLNSATGFLAAYAYAKVRLIDAVTLNVIKEVVVKETDVKPNYNMTAVSQRPWDNLSSQEKLVLLKVVVGNAMNTAVPQLMGK